MSKFLVARFVAAALLCSAALPACADVIVAYDFTSAVLTPTTIHADATASAINFTGSSASGTATESGLLNVTAATGSLTAQTAVSNNSYFQFDVTPASGFSLDLQTLEFSASNRLLNSVAGYAFRLVVDEVEYAVDGEAFPTTTSFNAYSIDLSSIPLITTTASLRVYTYSSQANFPITHAAYDDIVLNGEIAAVPEASTFYFLGFAAACCGVWKRFGPAVGV